MNRTMPKAYVGAVCLMYNPILPRHWMVAGPEVASAIMKFEDTVLHPRAHNAETHHCEETPRTQTAFTKDVQSL